VGAQSSAPECSETSIKIIAVSVMPNSDHLFVEELGRLRHTRARDVEVDSSAQEQTDFAFEIESRETGGSGYTACSPDGADDRVLLWQFSDQVIAEDSLTHSSG